MDIEREIVLKPVSGTSGLKDYTISNRYFMSIRSFLKGSAEGREVDDWFEIFEKVIKYRTLKPFTTDQVDITIATFF